MTSRNVPVIEGGGSGDQPEETTTTATPTVENPNVKTGSGLTQKAPAGPADPFLPSSTPEVQFPAVETLDAHEESRKDIEFWVASHVFNNPEWRAFADFVPQVAEYLNRAALEVPAIREEVVHNLTEALAMTNDEYILALSSGRDPSELTWMTEAFFEQLVIPGAEKAHAQMRLDDADNMHGRFDAAQIDRRVLADMALDQIVEEVENAGEIVARIFPRTEDGELPIESVGAVASAVSSRPGVWAFGNGMLAGEIEIGTRMTTVEVETPGGLIEQEVAEPQTAAFLIELDQGTTITNDSEAQTAMVLAFAGLKHKVGGDDLPGAQTDFGRFIETTVGPWANSAGIDARFRTDLTAQSVRAGLSLVNAVGIGSDSTAPTFEQIREQLDLEAPDHQVMGMMVGLYDAELRAAGIIADPFDIADALEEDLSPEEFARLRDQQAADIFDEVRQAGVDEGTIVTQIFDDTVEAAFNAAQWWEGITQQIGVAVLEHGIGDIRDAFLAWQGTLDQASDETVGDWFALSGRARDWTNLTASLVFDPGNAVFAGGAMRRIFMEALVTNPRLAQMAMRTQGMSGLVDDLLRFSVVDDTFVDTLGVIAPKLDRATRALFVVDGIRQPAHQRLQDLIMSGNATREQIEAVFMNEFPSAGTGGTFIPASFGNATRRNTAEGIYNLARRFPFMSEEGRAQVASMVMMLSDDSSIALRGTRGFDQVKRTIITLFPEDPERATALLNSYIDQTGGGVRTVENLQGTRIKLNQDLQTLMDSEIEGLVKTTTGGYNLSQLRNQIADLENALAATGGAGGTTGLADEITRLRGLQAQVEDRTRRIGEIKGQVNGISNDIEKIEAYLAQPFAEADNVLWWANFYEDLADEMELGFVFDADGEKIAHSVLPQKFERDWNAVLGITDEKAAEAFSQSFGTSRLPREGGLVPTEKAPQGLPAEEVAQLQATSAGLKPLAQRGYMDLPVTPWDLIMYQTLKDDPKTLTRWFGFLNKIRDQKLLAGVRTIFNTNLLINLSTPIKTRLDESLRILWETGNVEDFLRSTLAFIPGAEGNLTSEGIQFSREVGGIDSTQWGFQLTDNPNVGGKSRGWTGAAERFFNGSIAADDLAQMWARREAELLTPDELTRWWNDTGQHMYRDEQVTFEIGEEGSPLLTMSRPEDPIEAFGQMFDNYLVRVMDDPAMRGEFRERVIEVLNGRGTFGTAQDMKFFRNLNFLPTSGQDLLGITGQGIAGQRIGVFNPLWQTMYGRPGQRAGGVFFDNYFEYSNNLFLRAYGDQGRILTPQIVADRLNTTIDDATSLIKRGSAEPRLMELFSEGFVTEAYLRVQAAEYARARADDIMYNLVTRSIAGSAVDNPIMLPFFRAQTDFISYWHRQFTEGAITRIPRETLANLAEGNLVQRGVAGAVQTFENMPLNLKLLSRWAQLASHASKEEDAPPGSPGWFLNRFTFLPLRNGPGFLMNVVPQPGIGAVVPWWLLDDRVGDNEWMDTVRRFLPSLEFVESHVGSNLDWFDAIDAILPGSDRTIRGLLHNLGNFTAGMRGDPTFAPFGGELFATAGEFLQWVSSRITEASEPPGLPTAMRVNMGDSEIFNLVPGSPEFFAEASRVSEETRDQMSTLDGARGFASQFPGLGDPDFDAGHIQFYLPLVTSETDGGFLEIMQEANKITEGDMDDLFGDGTEENPGLLAKYKSGNIDQEELVGLLDLMSTLLFDRATEVNVGDPLPRKNAKGQVVGEIPGLSLLEVMLVTTPELSLNMVSTQQCLPKTDGSFFSDTHCSADGRLINVPHGEEGRLLRAQWKRDGSIGYKLEGGGDGWVMDAALRVEIAKGRVARYLYAVTTKREFGQGNTKAVDQRVVDMTDDARRLAETIGLRVPPGPVNGEVLRGYFSNYLNDTLIAGDINAGFYDSSTWGKFGRNHDLDAETGEPAEWSLEGIAQTRKNLEDYMKANGVGLYDLPEDVRQKFRDELFAPAIAHGVITEVDYARDAERIFGPLDFQVPSPPTLDSPEIDFRRTIDPSAVGKELVVLDGDTFRATTADGFVVFRLVGINAPESGEDGHIDALREMEEFLRDAETIDLVIFDPERYGRVQTFAGGNERIKVWLYVNGKPIWDPEAFTSDNPTGAAFGGTVLDLEGILQREEETKRSRTVGKAD